MSLEKIKAMVDVANQMEEMKKAVIKENVADRKQLRFQALEKIQEYFRDVAKIGDFGWVEIPVHIYWLNKGKYGDDYKLQIRVSNGDVEFWEQSSASSLNIENFCSKTKDDFLRDYGSTKKWCDGCLEIIENWQEIKKHFEIGLEKQLEERMNTTQKELANFKTSYEIVDKFTV